MNESAIVDPDGSPEGLFSILDGACRSGIMPGLLYAPPLGNDAMTPGNGIAGRAAPDGIANRAVSPGGSAALFPDLRKSVSAALLFELSADAFDSFIFAWMSELLVQGEIPRFGWKVLAAAGVVPVAPAPSLNGAGPPADAPGLLAEAVLRAARPGARREAERAASDRGDPDVRAVLDAAFKVVRETDRLAGLLRFASPGNGGCSGGGERNGLYLARCFPDHYVLPALAEHFTRRFGAGGWAVVDERRGLALLRRPGGDAEIVPAALLEPPDPAADDYEELWRHYHRTINNESRNNPALQRRFMPKRYWKYLPELR